MSARPKTPAKPWFEAINDSVPSLPAPPVFCESCGHMVPVAPHHYSVSVPHVRVDLVGYDTPAVRMQGAPCPGNEKRRWRDDLAHPAAVLALQHAILDDDRYWEGL